MNSGQGEPTMKLGPMRVAYVPVCATVVLLTYIGHEAAHWLAGTLLENPMGMDLNSAWPLSGTYLRPWHATVVDLAGPTFTLIQATVAYAMIARGGLLLWWYPLLMSAVVQRLVAAGLNVARPQDEVRAALFLGIGRYTLVLAVCGVLTTMAVQATRKPGFRFGLAVGILTISFLSALILGNQWARSVWWA
jgi:hypothetical protein